MTECLLLYSNAGHISKVSEEIATENSENCHFRQPHCHLAPPVESMCATSLVINSDFVTNLDRFLDMATYWPKMVSFSYPTHLSPSLVIL